MTSDNRTIAVLPGDGIGPEVLRQGLKVLRAVERRFGHTFATEAYPVGWVALDAHGTALPDEVRAACRRAGAVYLGAVGLPDRDATLPQDARPERAALLALREGCYANLRPIWLPPALATEGRHAADLLIVRELTGGLYFGRPRGRRTRDDGTVEAFDTLRYSEPEIERIARTAFEAARHRRRDVCSVDKANILASSALWREVVDRVAAEYPDVAYRHHLVDSVAPALVQRPEAFDVVLTGNLFGDILSDLGAVLAGSLGMLPSAAVGGPVGLFEPPHGSAPDIAGRDVANPLGAILTLGMLLAHAFCLYDEAAAVKAAVTAVLDAGVRTADIAAPGTTPLGCEAMGDRVAAAVEAGAHASG